MFSESLRKNKLGHQSSWSKDELLAGLNYFYELHGHFPSAHEIDAFEYLPSSRSIQRTYGGLVKLRSELLPKEIANLTKGTYRSSVAKQTYANGRAYEKEFYDFLLLNFEEIAVHEHKLIRPGNVSSDFFVYTAEHSGIVMDIFYAANIINLINVVNIKLKRYSLIAEKTCLILVGNDSITQEMINAKVKNRQIPIPDHIRIYSENYFKGPVVERMKKISKYAK